MSAPEMQILVEAVSEGYALCFMRGETSTRLPERYPSLERAIEYAYLLARQVEQTLGVRLEPLVTAQAIETGKDRDPDAARLWQNPDFHQHEVSGSRPVPESTAAAEQPKTQASLV